MTSIFETFHPDSDIGHHQFYGYPVKIYPILLQRESGPEDKTSKDLHGFCEAASE